MGVASVWCVVDRRVVYRPKLCRRHVQLQKKLRLYGSDLGDTPAVEIPILGKSNAITIKGDRLDTDPNFQKMIDAPSQAVQSNNGKKRKRGQEEDAKQMKLPIVFFAPPPPPTGIKRADKGKQREEAQRVRPLSLESC